MPRTGVTRPPRHGPSNAPCISAPAISKPSRFGHSGIGQQAAAGSQAADRRTSRKSAEERGPDDSRCPSRPRSSDPNSAEQRLRDTIAADSSHLPPVARTGSESAVRFSGSGSGQESAEPDARLTRLGGPGRTRLETSYIDPVSTFQFSRRSVMISLMEHIVALRRISSSIRQLRPTVASLVPDDRRTLAGR